MRLAIATTAFLVAAASTAPASSFVHVAPPDKGGAASIVAVGAPAPSGRRVSARPAAAAPGPKALTSRGFFDALGASVSPVRPSRSIIAMQSGEPPVTRETVAAVQSSRRAPSTPMVMRGGIVGDPFASPATPAASEPPADTEAAPSPRNGRPDRRAERGMPPATGDQREPAAPAQPDAPPPAAPPAQTIRPK